MIQKKLEKMYVDNPSNVNISRHDEIKIFYKAYMNTAYKAEEKALKDIINRNVKPANESVKLKLIIYYSNAKTANLIMKNNNRPPVSPMLRTGVVYRFTCPHVECDQQTYIGMTTTTLTRRLAGHLQSGSIKQHLHEKHNVRIDKNILENNTEILQAEQDRRRLLMLETIIISERNPALNIQGAGNNILPTARMPNGIGNPLIGDPVNSN